MVMLFKPYHVPMILEGRKTDTRRIWSKCRVKVGNTYQARTKLFDKGSTFAKLRILALGREQLMDITDEGAIKEGYSNRALFLEAFHKINDDEENPNPLVWVISFEVVP